MGARHPGCLAGKAREISTRRDYLAVKQLLPDLCKGASVYLEAERIEALIRELADYEDRAASVASQATVTQQSCQKAWRTFVVRKRWSDD